MSRAVFINLWSQNISPFVYDCNSLCTWLFSAYLEDWLFYAINSIFQETYSFGSWSTRLTLTPQTSNPGKKTHTHCNASEVVNVGPFLSALFDDVNCWNYITSVIDDWMSKEHWWNDNVQNWSTRRKSCPRATVSTKTPTRTCLNIVVLCRKLFFGLSYKWCK